VRSNREAGVNILTSLLFLKKKTVGEIDADLLGERPIDYPVFMAVAEKVGVDRRGNEV
jgi:type I restriction enzyme M protein